MMRRKFFTENGVYEVASKIQHVFFKQLVLLRISCCQESSKFQFSSLNIQVARRPDSLIAIRKSTTGVLHFPSNPLRCSYRDATEPCTTGILCSEIVIDYTTGLADSSIDNQHTATKLVYSDYSAYKDPTEPYNIGLCCGKRRWVS